jgi:hypothetical protein
MANVDITKAGCCSCEVQNELATDNPERLALFTTDRQPKSRASHLLYNSNIALEKVLDALRYCESRNGDILFC